MPNVVALIKDDRVRRQVEQYLEQLEMETLHFVAFKSHEEFESLYFRTSSAPAEATADSDNPAPQLQLFSEVHLFIFALDSINIKEKLQKWIDHAAVKFKHFKHWPVEGSMRFVLLKYEDDGISKLDVLHPLLDDLIYLPLDRLVFLQKMEIFLNLPKRVKSNFLFTQEVNHEIEISKISRLDRLSDVGLAIRNPIPLRKGLPGHFYLRFPSEKNILEVYGKVLRSEPHPEFPGQFLVYFQYFGLKKNELSAIRRVLSKVPRYQGLRNEDREAVRYKPDDLFQSPDNAQEFAIAVIDPDSQVASHVANQLNKDLDRLKVLSESSFLFFYHRYFEGLGSHIDKTPPLATDASQFFHDPLLLTVSKDGLKCMSVDPGPVAGDLLLGQPAMEFFGTPERWLDFIKDKGSRLILEESVQFAAMGRKTEKLMIFQDANDRRCAVNFRIDKGSSEALVSIEITPATLSDIVNKMTSEEANSRLDVLILDSAFAPADPTEWIANLRDRAMANNLIKDRAQLKFMFTQEGSSSIPEVWLNSPDIFSLLPKPVDHRQLAFLLSETLPDENTLFNFHNIGWTEPNLSLHVSKRVHLEALSEYGATLCTPQQLVPGTVIYLRRSIFENAPNQCLAARVYSCEPHSNGEKGQFQVYVTYFGINDQFLKFARTWIRENYAQQKSKEGG